MKMLNNLKNKSKARRISAARLLLVLCWVCMGLIVFLQAMPAISSLRRDPPAIIAHTDDSYTPVSREKKDAFLDINHAPAEDFLELPGIGPVYSQAIVAYREQVSRFYFLEDIMNVKGIGEKRFDAIRPFLLDPWENHLSDDQ